MTEATDYNIQRKSAYADRVQLRDGEPIWSWLEISTTDCCNRKCIFCPQSEPDKFIGAFLWMDIQLARKIGRELKLLDYQGAVVLSGFGEPLLHPRIIDLCAGLALSGARLEIVTNGDRLNSILLKRLVEVGVSYFVISLYDSPDQVGEMDKLFAHAGLTQDHYLLRDRWHGSDKGYGLKLTNRAGMVSIGEQPKVDVTRCCFYPAYSMTIDWNGDVLLCMQDWSKRARFGNIQTESLLEVWTNPQFMRWRRDLMIKGRNRGPCNNCNVDGMVHGVNHAKAWNAWGLT